MKATKCDMINILDTLMNGDVNVLYDIVGDNYDNYLQFYDIYKTLSHIVFSELLYTPNTIGLEVELCPVDVNDINLICEVMREYHSVNKAISYSLGGSSVTININIGGE